MRVGSDLLSFHGFERNLFEPAGVFALGVPRSEVCVIYCHALSYPFVRPVEPRVRNSDQLLCVKILELAVDLLHAATASSTATVNAISEASLASLGVLIFVRVGVDRLPSIVQQRRVLAVDF
jgi:hypothetical protein